MDKNKLKELKNLLNFVANQIKIMFYMAERGVIDESKG